MNPVFASALANGAQKEQACNRGAFSSRQALLSENGIGRILAEAFPSSKYRKGNGFFVSERYADAMNFSGPEQRIVLDFSSRNPFSDCLERKFFLICRQEDAGSLMENAERMVADKGFAATIAKLNASQAKHRYLGMDNLARSESGFCTQNAALAHTWQIDHGMAVVAVGEDGAKEANFEKCAYLVVDTRAIKLEVALAKVRNEAGMA